MKVRLMLLLRTTYPFFFKEYNGLSIAGRLDKLSHGLLLLSNDGKWVEATCHPKYEKEKEYIVKVDKPINGEFIKNFSFGVKIDNFITKPCVCYIIDTHIFNVILTEGKNRQIRKMCLSLGYKVLDLKRIRIGNVLLENLREGEVALIGNALQ